MKDHGNRENGNVMKLDQVRIVIQQELGGTQDTQKKCKSTNKTNE